MKKIILGLTLVGVLSSFASEINPDLFVENNDLKQCEEESVNEAVFLSFKNKVARANATGETNFHLSGESEYVNPKYVKPSFLDCMLLGDDCGKIRKFRNVEMPSNFESVIYEIIKDNSETKDDIKAIGNALGYGHGSRFESTTTHLDIHVSAVAGEISELAGKLARLTGAFPGDKRNSKIEFSKMYDAVFYCRK